MHVNRLFSEVAVELGNLPVNYSALEVASLLQDWLRLRLKAFMLPLDECGRDLLTLKLSDFPTEMSSFEKRDIEYFLESAPKKRQELMNHILRLIWTAIIVESDESCPYHLWPLKFLYDANEDKLVLYCDFCGWHEKESDAKLMIPDRDVLRRLRLNT